jgi:hypothetical protein
VAESLTAAEIARLFAAEKEQAPRRHGAGLAYFVGYTGVPSNDASTNRHEEHLAIALFREFGPSSDGMALPESGRLRLLDYQVPLEQRQADRGVGKVDLFGVDSSSTPWVIELKVKRSGRQDTPLRGLLQALAYCAALESNLDEISSDARERFGIWFRAEHPIACLLAPVDWWAEFRTDACTAAMGALAARVVEAAGIPVRFLAMRNVAFRFGQSGAPPYLASKPELRNAIDTHATAQPR